MRYKFCYKLIRTFSNVVCDRLNESTHRFLVIWRHGPVTSNQYLFILGQIAHGDRGSHPRHDVQNVQTHSMQGFQIARIRPPLVTLIAALGIAGYTANLRHFFLFEAQSASFFAQAFARTHIWEFSQ